MSDRHLYAKFTVHKGSAAEFANVRCYSVMEVVDHDEPGDMAALLREYLAKATPPIRQCEGASRLLLISYQAGRGVCIDCLSSSNDWSGFAFVTVNQSTGTEIAAAEWTGGGARSGRELACRFADDLVRVTSSGPPQ